jgi:adenylate kinase family enzyme
MERISVVGCTGSGESTMARSLAALLDIPHLELDSVYHQADWTPMPDGQFRSVVGTFTDQSRWVIDGNHHSTGVLDLARRKADTVVWLDPPRWVVMGRVTGRTFKRGAKREELWNGNRVSLHNVMKRDPEENIIRWSWTRFEPARVRYEARMADPRWSNLECCRPVSSAEATAFLQTHRDSR